LREQIKIHVKECQIDDLKFTDREKVIKILLLFNIQTILETHKSDMRFSFDKFINNDWDVEHVCSQTSKRIKSGKERANWIDVVLEYFTGTEDLQKAYEFKFDNEKEKDICNSLIEMKNSEKIDYEKFDNVFKKAQEYFKEHEQLEERDHIFNLALLDVHTNRSYKNFFFPIKRKIIIKNIKNGIFVPIATRNVFLKYYSKKMEGIMFWKEDDANDYLKAIKSTLREFLPEDKKYNG